MSRNIEQPKVFVDGDETTTTHPAFANISANRVSGGVYLYGSDFMHQSYIVVRIGASEQRRSLSNDWHYTPNDKEYIEVAMSESQWGAFVSSFGCGRGVPCTLTTRDGKRIPELPEPTNKTDVFRDEVNAKLEALDEAIADSLKEIEGLGLSKAKLEIARKALVKVRRATSDSVPFIAEQFEEHIERTVAKAKTEIHGYLMHNIAIGGNAPLQLPPGVLQLSPAVPEAQSSKSSAN